MSSDLVFTLEYQKPKLFLRIVLWILGIIFLAFISLFVYLNILSNRFIKTFTKAANINKEEFLATGTNFLDQLQKNYEQSQNLPKKYNFLVLGTDKLSGRDGDPELTDTILLIQINFENGLIKTLSLPRDLYHEEYQTKINALYFYGQEKYPDEPEKFPKEVLTEMTGFKIDQILVLGIEDLGALIDLVGGVEINVPVAFTDPTFPVPGVDVSKVTDPKILYKEISFEVGPQQMNADRALEYVRSRYSEGNEGTDESRALRQQLVLEALFKKISTIRNPETLGKLYRFYLDRFANFLSLDEINPLAANYLIYLEKNQSGQFTFEKHQLPIYPEDQNGVIYNPPLWQTKQQWLYKIKNQDKFYENIQTIFN